MGFYYFYLTRLLDNGSQHLMASPGQISPILTRGYRDTYLPYLSKCRGARGNESFHCAIFRSMQVGQYRYTETRSAQYTMLVQGSLHWIEYGFGYK
jgi:hypothetical protein